MNGLALAASPNWYCSRVCDCNIDGLVAFGAKGDVFLLDVSSKTPLYRGRLLSLGDRVVGLRFCQHEQNKNALVVASESGKVKVWDVISRVVTQEFHQHKAKAICVDWSVANPDLAASGDEKGFICLYTFKPKLPVQSHYLNKASIFCLSFCPHNDQTLAVGFRGGLILIVNVKQQCSTLHLLRRHEDDVQSLAWAPVQGCEFFGPKQNNSDSASSKSEDTILASSSKDGTLRFWSMLEGKQLSSSKMVTPSSHRPRHQDEHSKSRLWMTTYWPAFNPNLVYCSGPHGELISYDFLKEGKQQWEALTQNKGPVHQRPVYSIVGFKEYACTISMDRQIIIWNLSVPCSQVALPTLGGYVYCLHFSPVDAGLLAVGVGDNMIRVWKTQPSAPPYSVTTLWQGIRSKVTAISWHPVVEGRLAFGTEEGRIGVFNVLTNKPPAIFDTSHRGVVYTVTWAPNCSVDTQSTGEKNVGELTVYSCGQGRILVHNFRQVQHEARDIDDTIKKQNPRLEKFGTRTEVAWSPDHSLLAIGNEDGSIEIFAAPQLKRIVVVVEGRKLIQCLCWHPQFVTSSTEISDCQFWLAAASTDSVVHVYSLGQHIADAQSQDIEVIVTSSSCKLEGHSTRVVALCWNPHVSGRLASVSYDGTAQVWCVVTGNPVANFRGHSGRVYSTQWSPFDPDVVFTGGEDFTLQQWKVSEQKDKQPPETKYMKTKFKKGKGGRRDAPQRETEKDNDTPLDSVEALQDLLEKRKEELKTQQNESPVAENGESLKISPPVPCIPDGVEDEEQGTDDVETAAVTTTSSEPNQSEASGTKPSLKGTSSKKKKKRTYKSMFPQCGRLENRGRLYTLEDIVLLTDRAAGQLKSSENAETVYNENSVAAESSGLPIVPRSELVKLGGEDTAHLGVFGNRVDAMSTLKTEAVYHRDHDNVDYAIQTEIWRGNVSVGLKLAAEENCLSDWMVSIAPLASRELWKTMCQLYADQLVREGSHHQAVLYLLAIHNIYGAIDVLKTNVSYRDAMVLAKARLSPSDPILTELALEWASQATKEGNFDLAAKCFLSVKNFQQASDALARKSDACSLKIAARLSALNEDHNRATSLAQQSLTLFLLGDDWEGAKEVIDENSELKVYKNVVSLHQILQTELGRLNSDQNLWATHTPDVAASLQIWHPYHINGKPFLCAVLQAWIAKGLISLAGLDKASEALDKLHKNEQGWQQPRTIAQVAHRTSLALSKSLLAAVCGNDIQAMAHIVEALSLSFNCEFKQYFQALCRLLLPTGITDVGGILPVDENPELHLQDTLMLSVDSIKAYYCVAVLQTLLHGEFMKSDKKGDGGPTRPIGTLSEVVLAQCLLGLPPESSILRTEAEGIPFIDKEEDSDQSSEVADGVIQELKKHLLIDCRARIFVFEVQLECIKQASAQLAAKEKIYKPQKLSVRSQYSQNSAEDDQLVTDVDLVAEKPVAKGLSTSISENTEKTLDYGENLDDIVTASQDTSESGMDSDIVSEISSFTLDYSLPCSVRYSQANVNRRLLEVEVKRIEEQLLEMKYDQMLDFPNPLDSAATIIKYCKLKHWNSLARAVQVWLSNYTTTLVGKECDFLL